MKSKRKMGIKAFCINFLIAFLVFIPYIIQGNGTLALCDDFNLQQIPLNMMANKAIKNGEIGWTWNIDIGSSFIGATSFYVTGSPFFYLSLLFPAEWYPKLVGWIFMLKYAVAGLTSYIYLEQFCKEKKYAIIGSVLYAFSGFQATNMLFYHFHDAVAFFPLMMVGLDKLVQENKKGFFAFSVFLSAMINFYFFAAQAIFVILYFIIRYWMSDWKAYKKIWICMVEGVIGVGMAMFIFLPTIMFNMENPRATELMDFSKWFEIDRRILLNMFKVFFLPAENMRMQSYVVNQDYSSWSAYLPMISMLLVIIYITRNLKTWLTRFLIIFAVICTVPILNSSFHMFASSNYHRWYYMLVMMLSLASILVLENKEKYHIFRYVIGLVLLFIAILLGSIWWDANRFQMIFEQKNFYWIFVVGTAGVLVTGVIDIVFKKSKYHCTMMLVGIAIFSIITTSGMCKQYKAITTKVQEIGNEPVDEYYSKLMVFTKYENPNEAYRFSGIDNMQFIPGNISGTAVFLSTVNGSVIELHDLTTGGRKVFTPFENQGLAELLSAKYYIVKDEPADDKIVNVIKTKQSEYYVHERKNIAPIGFTYDSFITRSEFESYDMDKRLLIMLQTLVVKDEDVEEVSKVLKHFDAELYGTLDWEYLDSIMMERNSEASTEFYRDINGFRSTINSNEDKYAFFSVPHDVQWNATVNGKKADILNINGLMAVKVEAGLNDIQFRYTNWYCVTGCIVSLVFVGLFVIWVKKYGRHG